MNVSKAIKNVVCKHPEINSVDITTEVSPYVTRYETLIDSNGLAWLHELDRNNVYGDGYLFGCRALTIKKVIFNDPATIVFWSDGTKTVVKKQKPDGKKKFDKEKGLALAITKKMAGNTGVYYNEFKKWCE